MLEFFQNYGADILALIVALGSMATCIAQVIKARNISKESRQEIQITREGIVQAFQKAKIPTEWKIDVSKQIDKKLQAFADKLISIVKEHEEVRDLATLGILKILNYTAASNKLTDSERAQIEEIIAKISEEDKTVDISE